MLVGQAAVPAPADAAGYLYAVQQAEAVLMQAVGQALPGICGCVPDPILPVRAELASAFAAQVLALTLRHLHSSCVPLSLVTGISRRELEVEGKADSRDGPRALVSWQLDRYRGALSL